MRKTYRRRPKPTGKPNFRINAQILAPELRIVDENGSQLGVMPTRQALTLAQSRGYDLVEVFPKAEPPVAKFINYGQFLYQQAKQERKTRAHQKEVEIKGLWLSLRIGQHDLEVRKNQAKKFLEDGDKVRLEMNLRGRERQHQDLAKEIFQKFVSELQQEANIRVESDISMQGGRLSMVIANK